MYLQPNDAATAWRILAYASGWCEELPCQGHPLPLTGRPFLVPRNM